MRDASDKVRADFDQLLMAADELQAEGVWDPSRVITRYPEAEHATPLQAKRMQRLGIIAEVGLEQDVAVAAYEAHALPSLIYYGTSILLVTFERGGLPARWRRANAVIELVLAGELLVRTTLDDARAAGGVRGIPVPGQPDQRALSVYEMTPVELQRFLHGYEKLRDDARDYAARMKARA
jgi:hypothetical protein